MTPSSGGKAEAVAADRRNGAFPFLCNDDDNHVVTLTGWESPAGPCDEPQLEVHARLPVNATVVAAAMGVLEAVAEGACAWWGHMTPLRAAGDIAEQMAGLGDAPKGEDTSAGCTPMCTPCTHHLYLCGRAPLVHRATP
ncbi:DUF5953 family protein [Archangium sp.]|uniref:DUF5953 family protein n=1 Tax=Archangium sp. TaxID=1872627 RepID=UPI0039C85787